MWIHILKSSSSHLTTWSFLTLAIYPYHLLLQAGLLGWILYLYIADVCMSLLVSQHWDVHEQESIRERHL